MLIKTLKLSSPTTVLDPLPGPARALMIAELVEETQALHLIICQHQHEAEQIKQELFFFQPKLDGCVHLFPDWETLAYDQFSPPKEITAQRLALLAKLPLLVRGVVIVTLGTLMQRLPPKNYIQQHSFSLSVGEKLDLTQTQQHLIHLGYQHVSEVMTPGEFAIRGAIIDIFPSGSTLPYRIDLFDNDVDTIRTFSPESQLSIDKLACIHLLPAREYPFDKTSIQHFQHAWKTLLPTVKPESCQPYRSVSEGKVFAGIDYYFPLFFDTVSTLFDYIPSDARFFCSAGLGLMADAYWKDISTRYEQGRHDITRPILSPDTLWLKPNQLFERINTFKQYRIKETGHHPSISTPQHIEVNHRLASPLGPLIEFQHQTQHCILVVAESLGRKEVVKNLFQRCQIPLTELEGWNNFLAKPTAFAVTLGSLSSSISFHQPAITVLTENDLLGHKVIQRRKHDKTTETNQQTFIKSIAELAIGDPVVHLEHGIGRYIGLTRMTLGDQHNEFFTIEYQHSNKLYVPISSLHLISRYSTSQSEHAPLHALGTDTWAKTKKKALMKAYDVAAELLGIYAQREAFHGEAFSLHTQDYDSFSDGFIFEETEDQQAAINAVLNDLQSTKPMDRIVCGDVGFGKTEVAMRGAFVTVHNQHQVAILVPTTLLAEQHGQNFIDRFAQWPVNIQVLSRFKTPKEQKEIVAGLADGKVDIVIGTHKLLQEDIKFHRLGLLIIDEEHRFGVRQKEKLKKYKSKVNILTMTATPIPRTLNMSMANLRDFSIIATPPQKRLAIKTFVFEKKQTIVVEAIERELHRGGQVFFLHNDVKSIEYCAQELREWVPQASIRVAHGQMPERELENIMTDFYHQRFTILVCSTIIETGIDIPSANTIIMDRADKLGLAQLHQLRGRVGRSHHQAYAYLLYPNKDALTKDAQKRLEAISTLGELGAGFALATHDLEIRGAGELLGEEQSGQMNEVGFSLYLDLIEKAVRDLKSGKTPNYDLPVDKNNEVDLGLPALIPDDYLPDVHHRLGFYKRIADASSLETLEAIELEMIDRFGLLPQPAKNLFASMELKYIIKTIGIDKLRINREHIKIDFSSTTSVNPLTLIKLVQARPNTYKLVGQHQLQIRLSSPEPKERLVIVKQCLDLING